MNITFKLKNVQAYADMIGFPINSWSLYFGLTRFQGSFDDWSVDPPSGPVAADQPITAYFGDQTYVMVVYNEGESAHGQMAFQPQAFIAGTMYYLNMLSNAIETGEQIPPDTDVNPPPPVPPSRKIVPFLIGGLALLGVVLARKKRG